MILLPYSFPSDPLVTIARQDFSEKIMCLSIHELFLSWQENRHLNQLKDHLIINRMADGWDTPGADGLSELHPKQAEIHSFFLSYYRTILVEKIRNGVKSIGVPYNPNSLPSQWALVENSQLALATPEYGTKASEALAEVPNLICADPNMLYKWRPEAFEENSFYFVRPMGKAYVIARAGSEISFLNSDGTEVDDEASRKLGLIASRLDKTFQHEVWETLVFVHPLQTTFGMNSNFPILSSRGSTYRESLRRYLSNLIEENSQ